VGVHKPAEPRKYFLPRDGLAMPVTAVVDFGQSSSQQAGAQDATLSLYRPDERDKVELANAERPLAADLAAPTSYYPNPLLAGLYAMMRPGSLRPGRTVRA